MTKTSSILVNILLYVSITGVVGFEPTNTGVKVLCLAAWRHPIRRGDYSPED